MTMSPFKLISVSAIRPLVLHLEFADGLAGQVDLSDAVKRSPILNPLRDKAVFAKAGLDEWQSGVSFGDKDDLTLASDNLHGWLVEQRGETSHQQFLVWMRQHKLTLDEAADALGLSRRMVAYYRSGEKPIPKTVSLAMVGWEAIAA